MKIYKCIIGKT